MDVHSDGANCGEGKFVDPCRALAMPPVIDRLVQGLVIAPEQPVVIDQTGRAIVGNATPVAGMAVVTNTLVLKNIAAPLDGGGIGLLLMERAQISDDIPNFSWAQRVLPADRGHIGNVVRFSQSGANPVQDGA